MKIGIAAGLFVIVIAVIWFVVTGNGGAQQPSGDDEGYQASISGDKKTDDQRPANPWEEDYRVREPATTRGQLPADDDDAGKTRDDQRVKPGLGDDDTSGGGFTDKENPLGDDGTTDDGGDDTPAGDGGGFLEGGSDDAYGPIDLGEGGSGESTDGGGFTEDGTTDGGTTDDGRTGVSGDGGEETASTSDTGEATTYTVQKGDNGFWVIAEKHYGNGKYYTLIRDANPTVSSTALRPGKKLICPPLPKKSTTSGKYDKLLASADHGKVVTTETGKKHYVVKDGDRGFWDVAVAAYGNGNDWKAIQAANPSVDTHSLKPGMKLLIPKRDKKSSSGGGTSADAKDHGKIITSVTGNKYYVVKDGDRGFWDVAAAAWGNGSLWTAIQKANPTINPRTLRPGMKIKVPAKPKASELPIVRGSSPVGSSGESDASSDDDRPDFSGRME
ncbi:MAG: LysM peptidoglycan-binding domain-containing protein [Planctomycetota bacterium]